jgi:large subunit ribosomal protein L15
MKGRIDASKPITMRELCWSGAITKIRGGVKLLSRGSEDLKDLPPLHLELSSASQRAIDEIKNNGGSVTIVYKTPTTLKAMIKPWKFIRSPLDPVPKFKKVKKLLSYESKGAS